MKKYAYSLWTIALLALISFFSVGAGIIPAIIPAAVPTANKTGTGSLFTIATAAGTSGNCAQWAAGGNLGDSGSPCGGGGGSAFSAITGSTNSTAAMVVGTGASLATSGTGSLFANGIRSYTVATLPGSPATGQQAYITDGTSSTDCVAGGASTKVLCGYTGSAWAAESGGGGGGTSAKSVSISMQSVSADGVLTTLNTVGGGASTPVTILTLAANNYLRYQYVIPTTWDGSAITFRLWVVTSTNGTGNFSFAPASAPATTGTDYANLTYTTGSTATVAAPGGAGSGFYSELVTLTVPLTGLVAGKTVIIQAKRGGADTYASTIFGTSAEIVITY